MKGWSSHWIFEFLFLTLDPVFSQGRELTTAQRRVAAAVWSLMGATARNAQATATVPTTVENSFLMREIHAPHAMLKASTIYNELTWLLTLDGLIIAAGDAKRAKDAAKKKGKK